MGVDQAGDQATSAQIDPFGVRFGLRQQIDAAPNQRDLVVLDQHRAVGEFAALRVHRQHVSIEQQLFRHGTPSNLCVIAE